MGITSVNEILENRGGTWNRLWQRTYSRSWRVECSSRYDGPYVIRTSKQVPWIGAYYYVNSNEVDAGSFISDVEYTCESAGANPEHSTWIVKATYSPYDSNTFGSDPTLWPIRVTYGSKSYEKNVEEDQSGNPVRNSAGDRFETPVTVDDSRDMITVVRNELVATFDPTFPSTYRDTINSASWNGYDTHTVKCTSITSSDPQYDSSNQVWYYTITYVFEIMYEDPDESPNGWAKYILDQGYQALDGSGNKGLIQLKGQPASDPQLLDGSGHALASGGDPVFTTFNVYREKNFAAFNIDLSLALGRI